MGLKISSCSAQPINCVGRCCNGSTLEHPWCGLKPVQDKAIDNCFRTAMPTRIKVGDGGTSFWVDDWLPDSGAVANLVPMVSTSVKPEKWTVAVSELSLQDLTGYLNFASATMRWLTLLHGGYSALSD
uniref:Uncharacterized protein n=1 Tax=Oryza punctata TaxID=4537 RepID=A0A0E0LI72_ORYPU